MSPDWSFKRSFAIAGLALLHALEGLQNSLLLIILTLYISNLRLTFLSENLPALYKKPRNDTLKIKNANNNISEGFLVTVADVYLCDIF